MRTVASTWSDYSDAGGTQWPFLGAHQKVQIACKVAEFKVANGNTWWYRIASAPWNNDHYVSADPFKKMDQPLDTYLALPFDDDNVPNC
jgi:hypothetical protein